MPFTFKSNCMITSEEFSNLVYGVADATSTLTAMEIANTQFVVNATNDKILRYLNRTLIQTNYTEILDSNGSDSILTKHYPITAISSIKIADRPSDFATTTALDANEYVNRDTHITLYNLPYTKGRAKIQVVYTAGYTVADIPHDLKYALILQYKMDNKLINAGEASADQSLYTSGSSKMGESFSANKTYNEHGLSKEVIQILDGYKNNELPFNSMFDRVF
jgi:hypothetical protein